MLLHLTEKVVKLEYEHPYTLPILNDAIKRKEHFMFQYKNENNCFRLENLFVLFLHKYINKFMHLHTRKILFFRKKNLSF